MLFLTVNGMSERFDQIKFGRGGYPRTPAHGTAFLNLATGNLHVYFNFKLSKFPSVEKG